MLDKDFFNQYQKQLVWIFNTKIGRRLLGIKPGEFDINKKIFRLLSNGYLYHNEKGENVADFYGGNRFSERINKLFEWLPFFAYKRTYLGNSRWMLQPKFGLTTTAFYPNSIGANNPVQGTIVYATASATFSDLRGASDGTTATPQGNDNGGSVVRLESTSNQYRNLYRGYFLFDTSAIGSSATISAATLSLSGNGLSVTNGLGDIDIHIVSSSPANTNDLVVGDYDQVGSTSFANITYANWSTAQFSYGNVFTLNSSGIANISKTGISQFGSRSQWDLNNAPPSVSSTLVLSYLRCTFYNQDYGPKLTVTYSTTVTNAKTVTAKGRIKQANLAKTVTAKARLKISGIIKTIRSKADIKQINVAKSVTAKASIKQINLIKTSTAKARIKQANIANTITAKANINIPVSHSIQAKANIKQLGFPRTIQAKADIKQPNVTKNISAKSRIKIENNDENISSKARVKQAGVAKTVTAKARVKQINLDKSVTAKADIKQANLAKTVTAKARVKQAGVAKTVTAKGRIKQANLAKTVTAKARVKQAGVAKTVTATARMKQEGVTRTIRARGTIKQLNVARSIQGKANIWAFPAGYATMNRGTYPKVLNRGTYPKVFNDNRKI